MKPRAVITRFARIISTSRLPDKYKVSTSCLKDIDPQSIGPATRKFYTDVLSIGLSCEHELGNLLIYPLRSLNIYILSINGKRKLLALTKDCIKCSAKKDLSPHQQTHKHYFGNMPLWISIRSLSTFLIPQIKQLHVDDYFISDSDIFFLYTHDKMNHFAFIPCRFENKTVIEAFLKPLQLLANCLKNLISINSDRFLSAFNEPSEIIQEIAERLNL